ncbi:MAG: hypothetical protein AAF902_12575 [Chloroflexota bacterium]
MRLKRSLLILFIMISLMAVFSIRTANAGKKWVSTDSLYWTIESSCVNGAELVILTDSEQPLADAFETSITPKIVAHDRYGWDSETGVIDSTTPVPLGAYEFGYYPDAGGVLQISNPNIVKQASPITVELNGEQNAPVQIEYYLRTQIRYFDDVQPGKWALFMGNSTVGQQQTENAYVSQVENCRLDDLAIDSVGVVEHLIPNEIPPPYREVGSDFFKQAPIFQVEDLTGNIGLFLAPTGWVTGQPQSLTVNEGDRLTLEQVVPDNNETLFYQSMGNGEQSATVSVQFTTLVSADDGFIISNSPTISADGQNITFYSLSGIVLNELDYVVPDSPFGDLQIISPQGILPKISPDGDFVAFTSNRQDIESEPFFNPCSDNEKTSTFFDVFIYSDLNSSMQRRAFYDYPSSGCGEIVAGSNNLSIAESAPFDPANLSANTSNYPEFVFDTNFQLPITEVNDSNSRNDVMLGSSEPPYSQLLSVNANVTGNRESDQSAISADGNVVVFETSATDLFSNDTNEAQDLVIWERGSSGLEVVSVNSLELSSNGRSSFPDISRFGDHIVFQSFATNLTTANTNSNFQIYVRDRLAGCTVPISVNAAGEMGNGTSSAASISDDGRWVAFHSFSTNLVDGATDSFAHVYVADRDVNGDGNFFIDAASCVPEPIELQVASVTTDGVLANASSINADISGNGRFVTFQSNATNLAAEDTTADTDIFLRYIGPKIKLQFDEVVVEPTPTATPVPTVAPTIDPNIVFDEFIYLPMIRR